MINRDESYLDRLIAFIFDHVNTEPVDAFTAELVFEDVYTCFNRAREREERGRQTFSARCGTLLRILPKIREQLRDKPLDDCKALEEVLLNIAAKRPRRKPAS